MAFDIDNLDRVVAGDMNVYFYDAQGDNVLAAGYFNTLSREIAPGNIIMCTNSNEIMLCCISTVPGGQVIVNSQASVN